MKIGLLVAFLFLGASGVGQAQAPAPSEAPPAVRRLFASLRGVGPTKIRAVVVRRLGVPQRDVGSGRMIEQWDLPDGMLTLNSAPGWTSSVQFTETRTGKLFRFPSTRTPSRTRLLEGYEMMTLPEDGMRYWLGNLEFGAGPTYRYRDSGQNRDHRGAQGGNFFLRHPAGTVMVAYRLPFSGDTPLETLAEGTVVADLTFTAADDAGHRAVFSVAASEHRHRLELIASEPVTYLLDAGW